LTRRTAVRDPWVWGQVILATAVLFGVPWAAGRWSVLDPVGATRYVGWLLIGLGLITLYSGIAVLGRNLTPATEPLPEGQLVTRGIYRVVRHPIYLGVSTALGGYGCLRGGWWAGAVVFAVSVAYFERKARVEERFLVERMAGYEEYRRRVPRILPGGWH
jgi:protein-S-isoprenylcysteine O-methyltransferase Ste14